MLVNSRFWRSLIISHHMFINELHLHWVPNFIALGIYFLFGTTFSWNEGVDIYFNVEYVLLGRNFDFLGDYLLVTARYLVVTARYWCLMLVSACYCLFPLLVWTQICKWKVYVYINQRILAQILFRIFQKL